MRHTTITLAAITLTLAAGCAAPAPSSESPSAPVSVTIERATTTNVAESFEAGGVVRARLTSTIASRVVAEVAAVHVKAGDRVRRGAPLVTLDARELAANASHAAATLTETVESGHAADADVRAAEAALRLASASYDRVKTLHDTRAATAQEFDEATTALAGAEARLSGAQARASAAAAARTAAEAAQRTADVSASYAVLTAPFDGLIAERFVDPGAMASPGTPLVAVEDPSALRLEVQLDEARAARVAVGQTVDVLLDASPDAGWCTAQVAEIGRLNPASHNFLVKIELPPGSGARSGAFGRARFSGAAHRGITVAEASLVRRGQLTFVYLVTTDNVARLRAIVAGTPVGGRAEVLAGLADGDPVVANPPLSLTDGARVAGPRR